MLWKLGGWWQPMKPAKRRQRVGVNMLAAQHVRQTLCV